LKQAFVGEKTNEITAIPTLLQMLTLKSASATIDAMGTQRAIAHRISRHLPAVLTDIPEIGVLSLRIL
jgi:predicted transposase YbfD/YdcC